MSFAARFAAWSRDWLWRIALGTLLAAFPGAPMAATEPGKMYAIPSWGDYTLVYGPGTDPAMDSPEAMENMFRFWKGHGYTGVFLRSDLQQFEPFVRRNPREQMNPGLALMWRQLEVMARTYDYFTAAQQAAQRTGLEFWVYHPHIYSDGAPEDVGEEGPGRMVPWGYVSKVLFEHPEMVSIDRRGNRYWMVPEYAYPAVRTAKVGEFVHMATKYGVKRFIANMRSEVNQLIPPADHADRFGFNQPVVEEMQRLYGVDIRTDARFDVDSPAFNSSDPLVEKWRDLRGGYLTQFFRELRQGLRAVDPQIKIGITLAGEHIGPPLGNWRTDWRTWVDEGLVDYLVSPVFFEATLDRDVPRKGYLTNALAGVGTVSHETLRAYIAQSRHPEIEIIATGGPPYFLTPPQAPAGANGRQCDVWYSSYQLAWQQRWAQWMRDVREFGHIKFIEQNFDEVSPADVAGKSGGWGQLAYDPKRRACAGGWWRIGRGTDARPFAQSEVRRGATGQAMLLTSAPDRSGTFTGWHNSSPDRSKLSAALDTSITNGRCEFVFWLWRKSAESGLVAYLQGDGTQCDVGVRIAPKSGKVSYSTGTKAGAGSWVETEHIAATEQWEKLTVTVDLDARSYGAQLGEKTICEHVPLEIPQQRLVEQPGVNVPAPVPVFKEFQRVAFLPEGAPGSATVIDDVSVHWQPTLYFREPGPRVILGEDFENRAAESAGFEVTNGISYGAGEKSLRADGSATLTLKLAAVAESDLPLIVDIDVFLRSSEGFPYLVPNPATVSPHGTEISIAWPNGEAVAGFAAKDNHWHSWDGQAWRDTGVGIHYDAWNHVQLALGADGSCLLVVQPVGQVPARVATDRLPWPKTAGPLQLRIAPSRTAGHLSLYDNIAVTAGKRP